MPLTQRFDRHYFGAQSFLENASGKTPCGG
jgi:hypothetical protein